jgi:hypothetical protein
MCMCVIWLAASAVLWFADLSFFSR